MSWNPSWADAIASIESQGSGGYSAVGPTTQKGNRAYGKYQVMDFNIPTWTEKHLGQRLTPDQFLKSPEAQEAVFKGEFGSYVSKYGNPQDAASAWFTGRPQSEGANRSDALGTTGSGYVNKFNNALGTGATSTGGQPMMQPEQKPKGLLGGLFSDPDKRDMLAMALQGMTHNPNQGMMAALQGRVANRREDRKAAEAEAKSVTQRNRTADYLDKAAPGAGELFRSGNLSAKDALSISSKQETKALAERAAQAYREGNVQEAMAILTQLSPTAMGQQIAAGNKQRQSQLIQNGAFTATYPNGPDQPPVIVPNQAVIDAQAQAKTGGDLPANSRAAEEKDFTSIQTYDNLIQDINSIIADFGYKDGDFTGPLQVGPIGAIQGTLGKVGIGGEGNEEVNKARKKLERFKIRLVNASLRLNAGVQTEGDAKRAANELGSALTNEAAYAAIQELLRINERGRAMKAEAIELRRRRFGAGGAEIPSTPSTPAVGWKVIPAP
jgi:hypothetical protein